MKLVGFRNFLMLFGVFLMFCLQDTACRKVLHLPLEHPVILPACKDCLKIACRSHYLQHLCPKRFPSVIEGFNLGGNWYTTSSLICLPRGKYEKITKDMCQRGK